MKILIIDDNPAVRTTLRLVLADEDCEIAAVGSTTTGASTVPTVCSGSDA